MSYYDGHHVYDRLPRDLPAQIGGPSTRKGLTVWMILAVLALAVTTMAAGRRAQYRRLAVFGAVAVFVALTALFVSWFGEPLEIQRHTIGAVHQLSISLVIVVATGVDAAISILRGAHVAANGEAPAPAPPSDREGQDTHERADHDRSHEVSVDG